MFVFLAKHKLAHVVPLRFLPALQGKFSGKLSFEQTGLDSESCGDVAASQIVNENHEWDGLVLQLKSLLGLFRGLPAYFSLVAWELNNIFTFQLFQVEGLVVDIDVLDVANVEYAVHEEDGHQQNVNQKRNVGCRRREEQPPVEEDAVPNVVERTQYFPVALPLFPRTLVRLPHALPVVNITCLDRFEIQKF